MQVRLQGKDAGHKQLGYGHAANHYLQLALVMVVGVFSMLEAIRHQCPYHGRAVAASFGIVYALQVRLVWLSRPTFGLTRACKYSQLALAPCQHWWAVMNRCVVCVLIGQSQTSSQPLHLVS